MKNTNTVNILIRLLHELAVPVTRTGIIEELEKHPNPNSLQAISDLLNNWRVNNQLQMLTPPQLRDIKAPFVAMLTGNKLVVITHKDDKQVTIVNETGKEEVKDITQFNRLFPRMILTAEKRPKSGEEDYAQKRRKEFVNQWRNPVFIAGTFVLLLIWLLLHMDYLRSYNLQTVLLVIFKTTGLITSILLLLQNIDTNNPLIQKFCGTDSNKNCNAILSSDAAKVPMPMGIELSWSEVGFFYFAGTWLVLIYNIGDSGLLQALAIINRLSLLYTFYSIYYQWRIAKQWCVFCCIIQGLLWLEFFAFLPDLLHGLHFPGVADWGNFIIGMGVPLLLWIFLKPWMALLVQVNPLKQQINGYKYNKQLFQKLLEEGGKFELLPDGDSLVFGNTTDPKHVVTMVASPSCGHCARMHKTLSQWLSKRKDIKFQVVFSTRSDANRQLVVKHLLSIQIQKGKAAARKALNAWYLKGRGNYKIWVKQFPVVINNPATTEMIEKQNKWCLQAHIIATPTLFINGYKLPKIYRVEDIKYLI